MIPAGSGIESVLTADDPASDGNQDSPQRIQAPIVDKSTRPGVADLLDILEAALESADPAPAVRRALQLKDGRLFVQKGEEPPVDIGLSRSGRLLVVAAGKAAIPMVTAAEAVLGDRIDASIAVTVAGGNAAAEQAGLSRTMVFEAGHPLPDPSGLVAARQVATRLEALGEGDAVLVLLSGGASALLPLPAGRIPLIDLTAATSRLLGSAATIDEINSLRAHLGRLAGGGLVRLAYPAQVATLILSDVVSGFHERVGSGPTLPDPTTFADAGRILSKHELWGAMPASIGAHIRAGLAGQIGDTAKPGDPIFAHSMVHVIGSVADAIRGAEARAGELGYTTHVPDEHFEGEAREVGRAIAEGARRAANGEGPISAPTCFIFGGETTVTFKRLPGRGGRSRELALAAAVALDGLPHVTLAAMGTDGQDFGSEAAGGLVDMTTLERASAAGLDAKDALNRHDSGPFFETLGDAIVTGPTGTNVNDLVVALVGRPVGR